MAGLKVYLFCLSAETFLPCRFVAYFSLRALLTSS